MKDFEVAESPEQRFFRNSKDTSSTQVMKGASLKTCHIKGMGGRELKYSETEN